MEDAQTQAAYQQLSGMSRQELVRIYAAFNNWGWPQILGKPPVDEWDSLPEYRRKWMSEDMMTRHEFIEPYMKALRGLGITHEALEE